MPRLTPFSTVPPPANIENEYYGPQEKVKVAGAKKEARDTYSYAFNETVSLSDSVAYQANVDALLVAMKTQPKSLKGRLQVIKQIKKEIEADPVHAHKTDKELTKEAVKRYVDNPKNLESTNDKKTPCDVVIALTQEEVDVWLDPQRLAQKYKPFIQEHFRRRVDLFLMQLVSCFGTRLHFEVADTQHQAEKSKSLYVEFEGKKQKICERGTLPTHNSAHSSPFPCLAAYDAEKWEAFQEGKSAKPEGIYFLQNSDIYKGTNSTCKLPQFANVADITVDGGRHTSPFSNQALALINEISQGNKTLKKAMRGFLEALEIQIRDQKRVAKDPGIKASLQVYYDEVKALSQEFEANPDEWIFAKIDLLIDREETTSQMRAAMFRLRSETIRRNMRGQTELMNKIDQLAKQILKEMQTPADGKGKKLKAPAYYEEAFKLLLIDTMGTARDSERLTKLFAIIDPGKMGTRKVGIEKSKELIVAAGMHKGVDRITELAKTMREEMRLLRSEEVQHRGDTMRTLRAGKEWTQVKLGKELRARYPEQPSSQSTICRTERGYRMMSEELATQLSEAFDIPKELLLPQVFFV